MTVNKTYTVPDNIAEHLASQKIGDTGMLIVLMKKQPSEEPEEPMIIEDEIQFVYNPEYINGVPFAEKKVYIKLQYPVGSIIGIREKVWLREYYAMSTIIDNMEKTEYYYPADDYYSKSCSHGLPYKCEIIRKYSPSTMPHDAIRREVEVIGTECKRVQELTNKELFNIGFWRNLTGLKYPETTIPFGMREFELMNDWNAKYAKKGFGWEKDPFVELPEYKVVK